MNGITTSKDLTKNTAEFINYKKKTDISNMFDNIAADYDLINHLTTLGIDKKWRVVAVNETGNIKNKKVIDLATGTGDIAIRLSKKNPEKITAIDISEKMLHYAKQKVKELNLNNKIEFIQADSENLPFSDNSFDIATMGFGIRNCIYPEKALSEIYRVLKPKGKLVILEFSEPTRTPGHFLIRFYLKNLVPILGRTISHNKFAYNYLPKSINSFPAGKEFLNLMANAKFHNLSYKVMTLGLVSIYSGYKQNSTE